MASITELEQKVKDRFPNRLENVVVARDELTLELMPAHLHEVCLALRDESEFKFEVLLDVAGVDYLEYGVSEWVTNQATFTGFERASNNSNELRFIAWKKPRFAVVYHLLSIKHNHRIRLKVFIEEESMFVPSIISIWASADWYEREAFDLYGFLFEGHPDLRRLLTDYGFIGHPFRKDFPLSGNVEVRYDAALQRVVYDPVDIQPRILEPKVIRKEEEPALKEIHHV